MLTEPPFHELSLQNFILKKLHFSNIGKKEKLNPKFC